KGKDHGSDLRFVPTRPAAEARTYPGSSGVHKEGGATSQHPCGRESPEVRFRGQAGVFQGVRRPGVCARERPAFGTESPGQPTNRGRGLPARRGPLALSPLTPVSSGRADVFQPGLWPVLLRSTACLGNMRAGGRSQGWEGGSSGRTLKVRCGGEAETRPPGRAPRTQGRGFPNPPQASALTSAPPGRARESACPPVGSTARPAAIRGAPRLQLL
ncbi:hypothetical protein NDU88_000450, partial [Pleurodeles waltl]